MAKQRLDILLTETGLAPSREKAKAIIMSGVVFVGGVRRDKPGMSVDTDAEIEIKGEIMPYVSRGGKKLEKALRYFQVSPEGCTCIDCGASTGGFTDCLLQNGAKHVYSVDVGYGQLAWSIRSDARVTVMERTNVRYLTPEDFPEKMDLAVIDVSFISLRIVLPAVYNLLRDGGEVLCLIKPQFEAGREKVGKKGIVRDRAVHREVIDNFISDAEKIGFGVLGVTFSPIRGPEGNIEYLGRLKKDGRSAEEIDAFAVVEASHAELEQ